MTGMLSGFAFPQHHHVVQRGDTLSGIAFNAGVPLAELEHVNPQIINPDVISVGTVVHVPRAHHHVRTYVVRSGDTLSEIAWHHGESLSAIEAANPWIKNFDLIFPGDKITLGKRHAHSVARSSAPKAKHHRNHVTGKTEPGSGPVIGDEAVANTTHHRTHHAKIGASSIKRSAVKTAASTAVVHYKNPLRHVSGLVPERIDMGVDYSGNGPIYAIGTGTIVQVFSGGWPGGVYIRERLAHGPFAGKYVYYAESIRPSVSVGQHVKNNTVIGHMFTGGSGIETGWATSTPSTPASHAVYSEGAATRYGWNFSRFLHYLGAPAGLLGGRTLVGTMPKGFYYNGILPPIAHSAFRVAGGGPVSIPAIADTARNGFLPANYRVIYAFLRAHGYSKFAAAGILGNIWQESGGNPGSVGSGGCGLIGWTPCSVPVGNLSAQLYALLRYNEAIGSSSIARLNAAGSAADAASIFCFSFERPGLPALSNRVAAATAVASALGI